ncbi:thioredoxin reductase [Prauserella marina]|uniref:Thioredoxin reductase n=1 Tax=Prauserella marina TaxID=530584 RepID=A0A222VI98_9PSEU|nr:NAD(P)/FAD-dependent oxidoreductase [Prauserella marina]ASR33649.1 thioredoxin reductase [Prauserella marina]PWV82190.1 thioredoxin reductase [Prauserella marina]SDD21259.1 Thioredoxin reductase [Prauserella marina]
MRHRYDVVVVGGGAAGLGAALTLTRARRSVLVVDAGEPRNAPAGHVHNYLGREGIPPNELLADGRAEVAGYGGEVVTGRVVAAERRADDDFDVLLDDGRSVWARRLLLATGLTDELPDVPGLAERWGTDVLHCPYCHGWEVRDQAIGVLSTGPFGVHQALLFRQLTGDVTLLGHTGPELSDEQAGQLAARGIAVIAGEVTGVEVRSEGLSGVRLDTGAVVPLAALVVSPRMSANVSAFAGLGVEATDQYLQGHLIGSCVEADAAGATAVPGVWAAGNVTAVQAQVIGSAAAGTMAAAAINGDLVQEDTRRAVAESAAICS